MTYSGILYDSAWSRPHGTVWLCLAEAAGESGLCLAQAAGESGLCLAQAAGESGLCLAQAAGESGLCLDEVPTPGRDEVGLELPDSANRYPLTVNRQGGLRFTISDSRLAISRSLKFFANLMLLIGSAGLLLTILPVAAIEIKYNLSNLANSPNSANSPSSPPPPATGVSLGDLVGPINQTQAFSVNIPKIQANSVVIPNVDASDPKIYAQALKNGVAHALGTGLPGVNSDINRTIYLFAHSTSAPSLVAQYNAQFYLLNKLEPGDEINITFWAKNYKYRVAEIKITDPDDISFLIPQTGKEILVLATCTPPGTTWKRLLVLAEPAN